MQRFGAYELHRQLGVGGMAEVFLATRRGEHGFSKRVALKRVLPAFGQDAAFVAAFQAEARLVARLEHPAIATVHDFGRVGDAWFMALELVEGLDLRKLLAALRKEGEPLPTELAVLVATDIASALEHAHGLVLDGRQARIIHRDVSPSNVLLSVDGAVKLADFGIATALGGDRVTATGIVKGKAAYMAPEQALGRALDERTDLFALGVVLFEALAGRRPYDGGSDFETLMNAQRGEPLELGELARDADPQLIEIVKRLIAADPAARPRSATEVLDALALCAPPASARRRLAALVRRFASEVRSPEPAPSLDDDARTADGEATLSLGTDDARTIPDGPALAGPDHATRTRAAAAPTYSPAPVTPPTPFSVSVADAAPAPASRRNPSIPAAMLLLISIVAIGLGWRTLGATPPIEDGTAPPVGGPTTASDATSPVPITKQALEPAGATSEPEAVPEVPREPDAPPSSESSSPPTSERRTRAEPRQERAAARATQREAESPPPVEPRPQGLLRVVAVPIGEVTIDERSVGSAPVTVQLAAGEHAIVVTNGDAVERRTAVVVADATETVVVRF